MSKRLTDTEKWKIAWFRKLPPKMKCAWSFILDNCDHAGVWHEDIETLSHHVGEEITSEELELVFKEKITRFDNDKLFISSFIEFQYGELNPDSKVHASVIRKLSKHGIEYLGCGKFSYTLSDTLSDTIINNNKEKNKEKEKNKNKEKVKKINFDFEEAYTAYPRKEGKKEGIEKLRKTILTELDFQNFQKAVNNYAEKCRIENIDKQYIKHFSSFVSVWVDYLEYVPAEKVIRPVTGKQTLSDYAQHMFDNSPYKSGDVA